MNEDRGKWEVEAGESQYRKCGTRTQLGRPLVIFRRRLTPDRRNRQRKSNRLFEKRRRESDVAGTGCTTEKRTINLSKFYKSQDLFMSPRHYLQFVDGVEKVCGWQAGC